jgi:hypothetical protein
MLALLALVAALPAHPQEAGAPARAVPAWGRRIEWPAEGAPPPREHASFVLDAARGRAVVLAGSGYSPYGTPLADAWAFDLEEERWTPLETAGDALVPGGSQRVAEVADGAFPNGAFLHGGYGAGFAPLGDLWHLALADDAVVVARVAQQEPPPARMLHAFACDPAGERLVVFGGASRTALFEDTWLGTGTAEGVRWRELELEDGPGPRFGFAFAHDVAAGRLLVCGGQVPPDDGSSGLAFARDLWALDFTAEAPAWTLLAEYAEDELPGRRNPAFALDPRTGDLLVWGGTGDGATALPDLFVVRTRDEGAPVERVPEADDVPTRASCFGGVDPERGRALLGFGNTSRGAFHDLVEVLLRAPAAEDR